MSDRIVRRWIEWDWTLQPCQSGDLATSLIHLTPDIAGPRIPLVRRGEVMAEAVRLAEAGAVVVIPTRHPEVLGGPLPERLIPALHARTQSELDAGIQELLRVPAACRALWLEPVEALDLTKAPCPACFGDGQVNWDLRGVFVDCEECGGAGRPWDWVVVRGGEDPLRPAHVRRMRYDCAATSVPFSFRSWGAWCPRWHASAVGDVWRNREDAHYFDDDTIALRKGPTYSGALLDGEPTDERPKVAR